MITFLAFMIGGVLGIIVVAICSAAKCADCEMNATAPITAIEGIRNDIDKAREENETLLADLFCKYHCPVCCTREEIRRGELCG